MFASQWQRNHCMRRPPGLRRPTNQRFPSRDLQDRASRVPSGACAEPGSLLLRDDCTPVPRHSEARCCADRCRDVQAALSRSALRPSAGPIHRLGPWSHMLGCSLAIDAVLPSLPSARCIMQPSVHLLHPFCLPLFLSHALPPALCRRPSWRVAQVLLVPRRVGARVRGGLRVYEHI